MTIKRVNEKFKGEFNLASTHPLQSWEWGEFRKETGNKAIRLAEFKNGKIINSYQIMIHGVPQIPYRVGTLIKGPKPTEELIEELKKLGKKEKLLFIKMEPNIKRGENLIKKLKKWGCVPGKTLFTPTTFWIDLTKGEEDLMEGFHSKTRYNIRYAKRKGVKVAEDNSNKAFNKYVELTGETVERQGFYAHNEKYHRLMWEYLHKNMVKEKKSPIARLLTATYQKEIITTWIVFVWHDFLYYPYGASTKKYKNVQANNLMMWEAIRYAKALGLKTFDLWGREPGKGFTRFKEGYNPEVVEFLGTWDLITSHLYWPYRTMEFIRWNFLRARNKLGLTKPSF
jgi:lipid II:glycine glycyltransferase (peptidoglycan interpeptide bridge formation enzyme)